MTQQSNKTCSKNIKGIFQSFSTPPDKVIINKGYNCPFMFLTWDIVDLNDYLDTSFGQDVVLY